MTRIYTEDINRDEIVKILDARFEGYTVIPTLGRWQGKDEHSLVIELLNAPLYKVQDAANEIKRVNHQDAVLITEEQQTIAQFV